MKRIMLILCVFILSACGSNGEISYDAEWGDYSDSNVKTLEENNINYEVKDGVIFIEEKDLNKAQNCCS